MFDKRLYIVLSDEEKKAFEKLALKMHTTRSKLLRSLIRSAIITDIKAMKDDSHENDNA